MSIGSAVEAVTERTPDESGARVGTLLSVNVGLPRDVSWQGRTVHTGVWKYPVEGPRTVRRLNIDGDGQGDLAGHGGEQRAVLVYQVDSYRHWERELGRDDFSYGQFGENFTVEGLADDTVCIGDQFRIGTAVFEVTQPRVTCYRVGVRMADPRVPALLVAHHRPGFYLRVLTEGTVAAGDEIIQVGFGPEQMTVAEIDALLYLPGHPRRQLVRALNIPALSPGWQGSFQALLAEADQTGSSGNAGLVSTAPPPAWAGFRQLTVTGRQRESDTVFSLQLADPDAQPLPPALAGQYVTVRVPAESEGAPALLRSYSLSSPPASATYRISVKREPYGLAGRYLQNEPQIGQPLPVAAPRGTFVLRPGDAPILLLSAGVGATPVLAMLYALATTQSTREVWWLHGARNKTEHPFAEESARLLAQLPHGHQHICYSRAGSEDRLGRDFDTAGRLTPDLLGRLNLPAEAEAYLCGPSAFMAELSAGLVALGVEASRIHTEIFAAAPALTPGIASVAARPPHVPTGTPGLGPLIAFARSGLSVPWDPAYASLLELAEACDVPTRWSCRTGVCHTCETGLLSGAVDYQPDPLELPATGDALLCCSRPRGEIILDL